MAYFKLPRALICGHSYVYHLRTFANSPSNSFDENFGLNDIVVQWRSKGGKTWDMFEKQDLSFVLSTKPDIVYLELGGNDLDSDSSSDQVAHKALDISHYLINHGISLVIIGEVLHRHSSRNIAAASGAGSFG